MDKKKFNKFTRLDGIASNMALSGICKPISMIVSYIYVPIVLNYLGVEKYGVWATILTILSWITYFDIGIANGLRNKLTESIATKDNKKGKALVSSAYVFITMIMLFVTVIFCAIASFVNWERVFGVDNFSENLFAVVCVSVVFVALNFILSICKNVLYALQKAADVSLMELLLQILNVFGVLIAKFLVPCNLFIMALIYGVSSIIVNIVFSIVVYKRNKLLRPSFRCASFSIGKSLTSLGAQFFLVQICALILFTTDSLIISYLYGAADVTPYSTVNKLFMVISGVYMALLTPIWSATTKAKIEGEWCYLKTVMKKLMILMIPFILCATILMFVFRPLSSWWLGQELDYTHGLIPLGAFYCILTIWCNTYANISNGLELMRFSMVIAVIQAIFNIPLSLFFSKTLQMGTAGVLCGTVCVMSIAAFVQPIYIYKYIRNKLEC